jgi:hypothetical protein
MFDGGCLGWLSLDELSLGGGPVEGRFYESFHGQITEGSENKGASKYRQHCSTFLYDIEISVTL